MVSFCPDSSLLKALRSFGYARFSRLDSAQKSYHPIGSPISVNYLGGLGYCVFTGEKLVQYRYDKEDQSSGGK